MAQTLLLCKPGAVPGEAHSRRRRKGAENYWWRRWETPLGAQPWLNPAGTPCASRQQGFRLSFVQHGTLMVENQMEEQALRIWGAWKPPPPAAVLESGLPPRVNWRAVKRMTFGGDTCQSSGIMPPPLTAHLLLLAPPRRRSQARKTRRWRRAAPQAAPGGRSACSKKADDAWQRESRQLSALALLKRTFATPNGALTRTPPPTPAAHQAACP